MGKKKKNITIKQGLDGWVMTYGDMMSLLLTFFVLIVSFSSMQETKFKQAARSLKEAFGVMAEPEAVIEFNQPLVPNHDPTEEESELIYEVRAIEKLILDLDLDKQVEVEMTPDGVRFRIKAPFLFESGQASLKNVSHQLLDRMASFFQKFPAQIRVEGHTDSLPINTPKYPSNWELSAGRAVSVARYFQRSGVQPDRIAASGMGEYHPIAENTTAKGRDKNRRVEIFLKLDKKDLIRSSALPFAEPEEPALQDLTKAEENAPVRQIINPVTGKLGALPVAK